MSTATINKAAEQGPGDDQGQDGVRASAQRLVVLHEQLRGSPHTLSCHCGNPQNEGATCADLQKAVKELRDLVFPEVAAAEFAQREAFDAEVRGRRSLLSQRPVPTEDDDYLSMFE